MAAPRNTPLTVGFDLDLTLIDPRPGMIATMRALNAEFGTDFDGAEFAANLGPPLATVLRGWGVAEPEVEPLVRRFRELYSDRAIDSTVPMTGADAALRAVREAGGRVLVVTGKYQPNAALHLAALGWEVDVLAGDVFAADKGTVLREHHASVYVGDHLGDIIGAQAAEATAVAVATGPYDREALVDAGADVVFDDLTEFPDWLRRRGD